MTSKQKTGIILILFGLFFFMKAYFPAYFAFIKPFFSWQMILIIVGLYMIFTNYNAK